MSIPIQSRHFSPSRVADIIRSRSNPIRGLTPEAMVGAIEGWRRGYLRTLGLLWEEISDRDPRLKCGEMMRKAVLGGCRWEIVTRDDSAEAHEQKEFLFKFYSGLRTTNLLAQDLRGGVGALLRQMMMAVGARYAAHEILLRELPGGGLTADLIQIPVWLFSKTGNRLRLMTEELDCQGPPLEDGEWLVTVSDGLLLPASIAWLLKDWGFKDWLSYSEKFGTPVIDAETDAVPGSEEWESLRAAIETFAADGALIRNRNASIKMLEPAQGGDHPSAALVAYIDRCLASLWRGGDLSSMSADGSGQGASLQGDELKALLADDCALLSETLERSLDLFALRWKFGASVRPLARFQVRPPPCSVLKDLQIDSFLLSVGAPLGRSSTLARYNRTAVREGCAQLPAPALAPPPDARPDAPPDSRTVAISNVRRSRRRVLRPVAAGKIGRNGMISRQAVSAGRQPTGSVS